MCSENKSIQLWDGIKRIMGPSFCRLSEKIDSKELISILKQAKEDLSSMAEHTYRYIDVQNTHIDILI